jgi:hypothetical protein
MRTRPPSLSSPSQCPPSPQLLQNTISPCTMAAVSDMVLVAFFYLLCVGEYTSPSNTCPKRTTPLRKCDVQLWRRGTILDHAAPLSTLLRADSATISIANTKNGTKGAFVHQYAIQGAICPAQRPQLHHPSQQCDHQPHDPTDHLRQGHHNCSPLGGHVRLSPHPGIFWTECHPIVYAQGEPWL